MDKKNEGFIKDNEHISTSEIRQDILETQAEINKMAREEKGYRIIGDRLSIMKANVGKSSIIERKEFVKALKVLLENRRD